MQNKLQELTDRLYNEGLSKGKQEADRLIEQARQEAGSIVEKARQEADEMRAAAEKNAAEIRTRTEGDLKMAATQAIAAIRQQVEQMVVTEAVAGPVSEAFSDGTFVRDLISMVVRSFNAANPDGIGLEVILPTAAQNALEKAYGAEVVKNLDKGITVSNVKGLANGFRIGPKDGGYRLSFTADDFTDLIATYLRPATRKILFGE